MTTAKLTQSFAERYLTAQLVSKPAPKLNPDAFAHQDGFPVEPEEGENLMKEKKTHLQDMSQKAGWRQEVD